MSDVGPPLDLLLRRLAECPAEMLGEPTLPGGAGVRVDAVVFDLLRDLGARAVRPERLEPFVGAGPAVRNRLRLVLVAAWLLDDPWFVAARPDPEAVLAFLERGLSDLARFVVAELFVSEGERREELVRRTLAALGLRPAGETEPAAADRLVAVDSVERSRVLDASAAKMKRARELREAMAKKEAEEAAARYERE